MWCRKVTAGPLTHTAAPSLMDISMAEAPLDDKGPVIAVLFAMKALKDAGYVPSKKRSV